MPLVRCSKLAGLLSSSRYKTSILLRGPTLNISRNAMQAPKSNETATGDRVVDAMTRLRAFVLAKESEAAKYPCFARERPSLESSMATHSEAVSREPAERPARLCEVNNAVGNNAVGLRLHGSAANRRDFSHHAEASAGAGRDHARMCGDDVLLERRLQHIKARCRGRQEGRKILETSL